MKLTRQGVRDLGGNRRQRPSMPPFKPRQFDVDCSANGGASGIVLHVEAPSVRAAIRAANDILRRANTSFEVTQVREGGRVLWWI